jgi:hypothetical protein
MYYADHSSDSAVGKMTDKRGGGVRGGEASPRSQFLVVFAGGAGKYHQKKMILGGHPPSKPPMRTPAAFVL